MTVPAREATRVARVARPDEEPCSWTLTETTERIRTRAVSALEVVDAHLGRIERVDRQLQAFATVSADRARDAAGAADRALARGRICGPLHGAPVAIKDLDDVAGVPTGFGSRAWPARPAARSATYVERMVRAGAIVIGKTNVPEFGHKAVTDNHVIGPTSTPFAVGCNAGGSSGGSGAAVAAGLATVAQGGDGGGSIRIPAALCGVYGLKATFGRVAQAVRPNAFNTSGPFVHAGPMTRTIADAALVLSVMAGPDDGDPLSAPADGRDFAAGALRTIAGLRVAYLPTFGGYPVEPEVEACVATAVRALGEAGAHVDLVDDAMPLPHDEVTALWVRQMGTNYVGIVEGLRSRGTDLLSEGGDMLEPAVVEMIAAAARRTVTEAKRDEMLATQVVDWVGGLLERYEVLVSPTVGVARVPNGAYGATQGPRSVAGTVVDPAIGWCLTPALNFSGHPAASVPAPLTGDGMPVGMQVVGQRFAEDVVLAVGAAIERALPWRAVGLTT